MVNITSVVPCRAVRAYIGNIADQLTKFPSIFFNLNLKIVLLHSGSGRSTYNSFHCYCKLCKKRKKKLQSKCMFQVPESTIQIYSQSVPIRNGTGVQYYLCFDIRIN